MRNLIFSAVLLAVALIGFNMMISGALSAARDAKVRALPQPIAPSHSGLR